MIEAFIICCTFENLFFWSHSTTFLITHFFFVGEAPLIIARGGFSGLLPDSSVDSYSFVSQTSVPDAVLWCDVQLTKDGTGICFPDVTMKDASNMEVAYPNRKNSYLLNGVLTQDWFTIDFTFKDLTSVFCKFKLIFLFFFLLHLCCQEQFWLSYLIILIHRSFWILVNYRFYMVKW